MIAALVQKSNRAGKLELGQRMDAGSSWHPGDTPPSDSVSLQVIMWAKGTGSMHMVCHSAGYRMMYLLLSDFLQTPSLATTSSNVKNAEHEN